MTKYSSDITDNNLPKYEVDYTDEFKQWWETLDAKEKTKIAAGVKLLKEMGPILDSRYSSSIQSSRHKHMRELRVQHKGKPYRILYAFNSHRVAVLLLGSNKVGNDRWYEENVPKADRLYDEHLKESKAEEKDLHEDKIF
jgi:hypothetical protein